MVRTKVPVQVQRSARCFLPLGQGILSTTKEISTGVPSPLLDPAYRARQYAREVRQIQEWYEEEMKLAQPKSRGGKKKKSVSAAPAGITTFLEKVCM